MESNLDNQTFSVKEIDEIGMIFLKRGFLLHTNDLNVRDRILSCLDALSKSKSIKVIAFIGAPDSKGREEYFEFFNQGLNSEKYFLTIHRMLNITSQLIEKIVTLDKIVIYANSGAVLSYFLNIGLACDYRIFEENTLIQNPCLEFGMISKGGGAYFLPKMIGIPKAYQVLFSTRDISADEAQQLGIIDEISPKNQVEETVFKAAQRFKKIRPNALSGIKRMMNYQYRDLKEYMEYENQEFCRIIGDFY